MITFKRAQQLISENIAKLPLEKTHINQLVGRILAEDVYSKLDMPPFNKSAMDGYALRAADSRSLPFKLKCIGIVAAGGDFRKKVKFGECVKIMTGAPIPEGADSVVMVEYTRKCGGYAEITKEVKRGQHVCLKGEDIRRGQKVIDSGTKITISHISLIAALGRQFLKTISLPKVAILNTGGEIIPLGKKLARNKIYNSNGPQLCALLASDKINCFNLGVAKDKPSQLKAAIRKGLEYDVLLISGGVSMGDYDFVPDILKNLGVKNIFHKVKVKPGKPVLFGKKGKKIIFGIPGNPVSGFMAYQLFIRPALHKMMGYSEPSLSFEQGFITKDFCKKGDRKLFSPIKISKDNSKYYLEPLSSHGSADIYTLAQADGAMMIDENISCVRKNSQTLFITWKKI